MGQRVSKQEKEPLKDSPPNLLAELSEHLSAFDSALTRQGERLGAVLEIASAISSARDVEALLRLTIDRISGLVGAEAATLFMLDVQKNELWSRVLRGASLKELRVPADHGIVGQVVRTGVTLQIADAYADRRFNPETDRRTGFKTRSIIAAPLKHVSGRVLGVIQVLHRKVNAFTAEDRALIEALAAQIAAVLDNVYLYEELRAQNLQLSETSAQLKEAVRDLDLLYEIERSVSATAEGNELLDAILLRALSATGATSGSILLSEEDGGWLYFRSAAGEKSSALKELRLPPGKGIAGRVAATGKVIRVDDVEKSPHYEKSFGRKLGVQIESALCVPIPGEQGNLGALELLNKPGGFEVSDERVATLIAGQTGRAILLRRAREEGERKGRLAAIGQMLSGVLHDLRTPMTVISGYAQLMAMEASAEEREKIAAIIEGQFDHVSAMTKETLAFARGEQEVLLRKVYLQHFVAEVEPLVRSELEGQDIEFKVQASELGALKADATKLKRLVHNIVRNAAQAMPDGGRFTWQIDREEQHVVMRFTDTGPGIPKEIVDKLFGAFVTSGKKEGTGLGLAMVKKICDEHGGSVTCRSKPGKGTTFEVRLPALGAPAIRPI